MIFGKRVKDRAVYLNVLEGPHTVRYAARIGDFKPLHSRAVAGRARGWYVTRGENVADVMAVAPPVAINDEMFAIAVAGPPQHMTRHLDRHAAALVAVRQTLEAAG